MSIFLSGIETITYSQSPEILWTKTFGGNNSDNGNYVLQTADGGFIIVGTSFSDSTERNQVWLIRTDNLGNQIWDRTYGGTGHEYGYSVYQTSDGGFVITGSTNSNNPLGDAFLLKTDFDGDEVWFKTYGDSSDSETGYRVKELSDGGYIISGHTADTSSNTTDVLLIRTDELGNLIWLKTFGETGSEYGYSVQEVSPAGFIIAGYTTSIFGAGNADVWLIHTDYSGNIIWTKTFGGSGFDYAYSVQQTSDGGFIIAGGTTSYGSGTLDVWLIRLNSSGDSLWTKTYGSTKNEIASSIKQTTDGGFIVTGGAAALGEEADVFIIRINSSGDTLWTKTLGGDYYDYGNAVQQTSDGGYIIAGTTFVDEDNSDAWLIRLATESTTSLENQNTTKPDQFMLSQNYPNPFNPATKISWQSQINSWQTLKIYDVLGNEVAILVDEYRPAGSYEIVFNAGNLPSGVYFYQLQAGNFKGTKKLILMR
jgi:hypothetical protein